MKDVEISSLCLDSWHVFSLPQDKMCDKMLRKVFCLQNKFPGFECLDGGVCQLTV